MPRCVRTAHVFEKKWRSDDVRLQEEASFSSLLLPEKILLGLENAGYKTPSPIQLESIPVGRFGRDLLVQAKSGTGKTLVFTVIALESLSEIKYPQVLIMAPTREIALQICDVVRAVGSAFKGLTCNCFIGGISVDSDVERVHGCQIIVGTPGRLKHLISLGILPTNSIRLLVLDEADVLLESNFKDDLDYIFVSLPKEKQVIATSATYPRELRTLTRQYFRKAYLARLNRNELTLLGMVHYIQILELPKMSLLAYKAKLEALEKVVTSVQFTQCLVFCNLISRVESLCYDIRNWGFTSTFISSAKEQCDRIRAIECLKRFRCKILVTSDVTSRGIDAENVDLVVNFDKPLNTEVYFHRCGRAGRYGAKGVAITFLEKEEVIAFEQLKLKHNLRAYNLPDPIPTNLINIRPTDDDSSTENSEEDDYSSGEESVKDTDDQNIQLNEPTVNGKTPKKTDSRKLRNGNVSSDLNGHIVEKNDGIKSIEDTNCNLNTSVEIDASNEKSDSALIQTSDKSDSSSSDTVTLNIISEGMEFNNNREIVETNDSERTMNGNDHTVSEASATNEIVKNSFQEFLDILNISNGPENNSFSATLVPDSDISVNNNISTDHMLEQINNSNLEAHDADLQSGIQNSSETQSSNYVTDTLEADNNVIDSKSLNQTVSNEDSKEDSAELNLPSDTLEPPAQVENTKVVSVDVSAPALSNTSASDKVSKNGSNEKENKFVPNKIQLAVGKFLIERVDNCNASDKKSISDLNSIEMDISSSNNDISSDKIETEDITKKLEGVREDLTNFYSRVYKTYQAENLNDIAFESIKVLLEQQKNEAKKDSIKENLNNIAASTHNIRNSDELNEENNQNPNGSKLSDNECSGGLFSVVNKESISSEENPPENQVYERYIFKDNSSDDSLSSSDSSSNKDSYLTLKGSFDNMKTSVKANSKSDLPVSQKQDTEKYIDMKKKKFSANANKSQHLSSENVKKSGSDAISSDIDNESISSQDKMSEVSQGFKDNSSSSTDSAYNEDSCLTLKGAYGGRKKSERTSSNGKVPASQLRDKEKDINMKKKKLSVNADKRQHSLPVQIKESSSSEYLCVVSSDEATERKLQEQHGARQKIPKEKHIFKHIINKQHQTKNNMEGSKNKTKSYNAVKIDEQSNITFSTVSDTSEDLHSLRHAHSSSTPYYKRSIAVNDSHIPTTSATNYVNIPSTSYDRDHAASMHRHIPYMRQPHEHTTHKMNCGNIPSSSSDRGYISYMNQPHEHHTHRMNYGNVPSTSYNHNHTTSTHGLIPSLNQLHEHTTSRMCLPFDPTANAMNYGNFSSMNYCHQCQLPNSSSCHQNNRPVSCNYTPNQVGVSRTARRSHCQLENACCHNCSGNWYQMYMKQWQFIHSSISNFSNFSQ